MESKILPPEFTYYEVKNYENFLEFRIKEVTEEASAKDWISKLGQYTKTTWRIARTYPGSSRCNLFKIDMRCQHTTDKRIQGVKSTKNTNCPAKLQITIKRWDDKHSSGKTGDLLKSGPTICIFHYKHNHALESVETLKHRDLGQDSREMLCSLFRSGHGPSSAVRCLKMNLKLKYGNDYSKIVKDGFYVPTISVANNLYHKISCQSRKYKRPRIDCQCKKTIINQSIPGFANVLEENLVENGLDSNGHGPIVIQVRSQHNGDLVDLAVKEEIVTTTLFENVEITESQMLTDIELMEFDELIKRIKDGYEKTPEMFVPAVRNMLENSKKFAATQSGLLSALHTFGLYCDIGKSGQTENHLQNIWLNSSSS